MFATSSSIQMSEQSQGNERSRHWICAFFCHAPQTFQQKSKVLICSKNRAVEEEKVEKQLLKKKHFLTLLHGSAVSTTNSLHITTWAVCVNEVVWVDSWHFAIAGGAFFFFFFFV